MFVQMHSRACAREVGELGKPQEMCTKSPGPGKAAGSALPDS